MGKVIFERSSFKKISVFLRHNRIARIHSLEYVIHFSSGTWGRGTCVQVSPLPFLFSEKFSFVKLGRININLALKRGASLVLSTSQREWNNCYVILYNFRNHRVLINLMMYWILFGWSLIWIDGYLCYKRF